MNQDPLHITGNAESAGYWLSVQLGGTLMGLLSEKYVQVKNVNLVLQLDRLYRARID